MSPQYTFCSVFLGSWLHPDNHSEDLGSTEKKDNLWSQWGRFFLITTGSNFKQQVFLASSDGYKKCVFCVPVCRWGVYMCVCVCVCVCMYMCVVYVCVSCMRERDLAIICVYFTWSIFMHLYPINSGSWWWTGRPGVLRFMGSQRVRHDWATELIL